MTLSIAQKQNYLYVLLILATIAIAIFSYRAFEKKWVLFRRAENKYQEQKFNEAIDLYQQALALGLTYPHTFAHLADAYVAAGNFAEAIKWYRRYLDFYPNDAEARLSYAQALNWNGNIKEADEEYQKVLKQHEMDQNS